MYKPNTRQLWALAEDLRELGGGTEAHINAWADLPLHVRDALVLNTAIAGGATVAVAANALLIRYNERVTMIRLLYNEELNDYLLDLAYPALI